MASFDKNEYVSRLQNNILFVVRPGGHEDQQQLAGAGTGPPPAQPAGAGAGPPPAQPAAPSTLYGAAAVNAQAPLHRSLQRQCALSPYSVQEEQEGSQCQKRH